MIVGRTDRGWNWRGALAEIGQKRDDGRIFQCCTKRLLKFCSSKGTRILEAFPPAWLIERAQASLESLGVTVLLNRRFRHDVTSKGVMAGLSLSKQRNVSLGRGQRGIAHSRFTGVH